MVFQYLYFHGHEALPSPSALALRTGVSTRRSGNTRPCCQRQSAPRVVPQGPSGQLGRHCGLRSTPIIPEQSLGHDPHHPQGSRAVLIPRLGCSLLVPYIQNVDAGGCCLAHTRHVVLGQPSNLHISCSMRLLGERRTWQLLVHFLWWILIVQRTWPCRRGQGSGSRKSVVDLVLPKRAP